MKQNMNVAEFCLVMAITIEQARSMPEYKFNYTSCSGVCSLIYRAHCQDLISARRAGKLERLVIKLWPRNKQGRIFSDGSHLYMYRPHAWKPRAKFLRKMARHIIRNNLNL